MFAEENDTITPYVLIALYVLVVGLAVAILKKSNTNKEAFIPALFFMIVVTTIEWFPALRVNEKDWLLLMLIPLQICNAYQLLMLPKFIQSKKS
jgi:KinB signaling pathway activation protein